MLTVKEFEDQIKSFFPTATHCYTEKERTADTRWDYLFIAPGLIVRYVHKEPKPILLPWKIESDKRGIAIGKTLEQAIQSLPSNPN